MKTLNLFPCEERPSLLEFESLVRRQGYACIAGIDEAGRGPLAGPVVAAAVILPNGVELPGVNDSKKLSPVKRNELFDLIMASASAVGVGSSDAGLIDEINILQATLAAMKQAVSMLCIPPDYLLIDGISKVPLSIPQKTIKKGDSLSLSIAAASIIAKVSRDRLMMDYETRFPGYGFAAHKGYGCVSHMAAIAELGPCAIHRKTFRGVKEYVRSEE
ncbi:ribonuclease HII [Geotalea uraniireducens]|uniref:Ribonuclease HII n=1 Tax=Geotalea uraniireducens (strain Rf4) TaxID=351605 RepID=RNH2_GEOUR|nr:ribonuclease HII [Geotalea uraniireducens]A5G7Z2.1 RecName: Full=Ribonuclease HII; Short=RNase HII [Geotalea uraniireducens Rf4]ABQ27910.1 RNase HII [Geotalea uraniireducens Rf4]